MKRAASVAILLVAMLGSILPAAQAETRAWKFQVFLDQRDIGYHHFTLRSDGNSSELRSEANFQVRLLLFTAYRYLHDATETWRGDCLKTLRARTDDNGERNTVDWTDADSGCAMSFAYWNPKILRGGRLLNAQTGAFNTVTVTPQPDETIDVRGQPTVAQRYRLAGSLLSIDLWYAKQEWVALESATKGGRRLRYRLM